MNETTDADALLCLDLPADAPPLQVERALRRKQALYAEGALATYSLLEAGARQALLERYADACRAAGGDSRDAQAPVVATTEWPPAADPVACPGLFLRARRQAAGLSLRDIANRTKISPMQLTQMEEERYALLPAPVYLRGFVVAYARALGLPDYEALAGVFIARRREMLAEL